MNDNPNNNSGKSRRAVLESLAREYIRPLNAFAYSIISDRMAAEDIVQDVFVNLWLKREKIEFGDSIGNYLYSAVRNASYNYLRTTKKFAHGDGGESERVAKNDIISSVEATGLYMLEAEVNRLLSEAIEQLPPRTAEVILLTIKGLRQEQIAEQMGVTVSNVKNLKKLGLAKLRKILGIYYIFILLKIK